jgi:transcription termination/antitermination protein NusA
LTFRRKNISYSFTKWYWLARSGRAKSETQVFPAFLFAGTVAVPLLQDSMNADFIAGLEFWEREKGVSRETLMAAVQEALLQAAKKAVGPARELRVQMDQKSGDIRAFAKLIVADKVISQHDQIAVFDARRIKADAKVGDEIEKEVTPQGFGRIAAQYAKQALMQKVRQAEKAMLITEYKDRVGDIVSGTVRRFDRSDVILDLGKYEALMPNKERVPTEEYQVGERIRAYIKAVQEGPHGPEIILSRADTRFIVKLFQVEVSEINDGTIEIKGIAREPGFRTKMAVYSRDPKVDPVGACVGMRGQRVKNIVRELNNEKVDVIPWSPDIKAFVTKALEPAKIKSIEVDEPRKTLHILVAEDQLSLAIGKRGQNARLTQRLTGWEVDINAEQVLTKGFDEQIAEAVAKMAAIPGITREQADALVHAGITRIEDLVQAEAGDLADIPNIGDAAAILEAARAEAGRRRIRLDGNDQPNGSSSNS